MLFRSPWNEKASEAAAENGHLSCLQYLREQGCPWDEKASEAAADYGNLHCLDYLTEQGCPWSITATAHTICNAEGAVLNNDIDIYMRILFRLVDNKVPDYEHILDMPLYVEYCNASSPWLK